MEAVSILVTGTINGLPLKLVTMAQDLFDMRPEL